MRLLFRWLNAMAWPKPKFFAKRRSMLRQRVAFKKRVLCQRLVNWLSNPSHRPFSIQWRPFHVHVWKYPWPDYRRCGCGRYEWWWHCGIAWKPYIPNDRNVIFRAYNEAGIYVGGEYQVDPRRWERRKEELRKKRESALAKKSP